jgi:RimJ/RimL family protein N-acetyltransferase
MSTDRPFVGVFAQSRWLTADETVSAHRALLREFAEFSPRSTRWWFPTGKSIPQVAGAAADQHLVMGSLEQIRRTSAVPLPRDWSLRRLDAAIEVETGFAELYQDFHRARPDLAQAVLATPSEGLTECARAGGLYVCFAGADLVGVVAAKPDTEYYVDAWLMWDIVLARKYCGRGLAPALQRAVLDRFDLERASFVAGTIDARNLPSLKTALRVGRQVVGTWVFIEASDSL